MPSVRPARTAEACAIASMISTPGITAWFGKWPAKNGSLALTFNQDVAASAVDATLWPLLGSVISFEVRQRDLVEIVCKYSVVVVDELTKVRVNDECLVVVAVVFLACDFHLDHLELVFGCHSRGGDVKVNSVDVDHYELC